MDIRFDSIYTDPENQVFRVVFFPDRIYHSRYLNATRSKRYRYNVREVRSQAEVTVLKGEIYLDGKFMTNFVRVEYVGSRLQEKVRENGRILRDDVMAWIKLLPNDAALTAEETVTLTYCPWIRAFQVEIWETLEPPTGSTHDVKVLDQMGYRGAITRVNQMSPALGDIDSIQKIEAAFREGTHDQPAGYRINAPEWDNNYLRSYQQPVTTQPSDSRNTINTQNYMLNFQRGWYLDSKNVQPVRYRNAMMNDNDDRRFENNIIEMRWILQREMGGNLVFFHEVRIPPGTIEGTHRHIGSEELYYIIEGEGLAYLGENDDPATAHFPTVTVPIYGLDPKACKEVPVAPGNVIYTKSGGIHGIRNTGTKELRFVAFLYHSA